MPARPPHPAPVPPPQTDALGCSASKLAVSRELSTDDLTFYRKSTSDARFGSVGTAASDRGFLVGVAMHGGHRRRIFEGRRAATYDFDAGSIYIRDFAEDYRADLKGAFDFLMIELPPGFIERLSDERGGRKIRHLLPQQGPGDAVLAHLAQAAAVVLDQPGPASPLLVDHLGLAIGSHLLEQYGAGGTDRRAEARPGGKLSPTLEARAKDMLLSDMDEEISIAAIADACKLSRGYFIKAFRQTVGVTPHRWLTEQRVHKVCHLLRFSRMSMAEIALLCGFADQPHMTRAFSKVTGVTPGAWRRAGEG